MSTDTTVVTCPNCGRKNRVPARTSTSGTPRCGHCHQRLPWIAEADDASFEDVADKAEIPVLVDLWAPWCGPCHMVSPALDKLAAEKAGRLKLVRVDVDKSPRVAQRFGAQGIPTLLVMRHGEVIARRTGAAAEAVLRTWLDEALPPAEPAPGTSSS
jgi:thioredoxin 2